MNFVRRVSGAIAISFVLTGCAVASHTPIAAATPIPTCDKTLIELNHISTSLIIKSHIPLMAPGPMRLCRFRWNNAEKKLALIADITRPLAPVALLRGLSELKAWNGVYTPGAMFACPSSQGNVDVIILQAPTGSKLTVVEVQRDACGWVFLTHPGSTSYVAYLGAVRIGVLLDALKAPLALQTKNLPTIRVTPPNNLRDGQEVLVQIIGASPNERFRISECATSVYVNVYGCGDQPAAQPFIDTDPSGAGSILFYIHARAATKTITTIFEPCTVNCVIMATGTNIDGLSTFVYAPMTISK